MPDGPTPAPTDVLGGTPPPPTLDNAPLNIRQAPPAPGPQAPDAHSTLVGKVFKHVTNALEGTQTQYVPDTLPDGTPTGAVRATQVTRKPGGIFRDILGGMLTGMAAASAPTEHPSGAAGLGLGYTAARGQAQQQDVQARDRAMQQAAAQKTAGEKASTEKQQSDVAQAAIAQNFVSALNLGHNIGFHDDSEVDQHNNAVDVVKSEALKAGGQLAQVDGNGKPGNGPALMAAYNKDPRLLQGPDGFHRIPSISYDTKGLVHKDGKWAEQDGSDPDWNKRATVSLVDLPNSAWGKQIAISRQAANDVAGRTISEGKPTGTVSTTFGGLFGLGMKNIAQMNSEREERERGPAEEKEAEQWIAAAKDADKDSPDYAQIQKRAEKGQEFLDAKAGTSLAGKAASAAAIKLETEGLEKNLAAGTITQKDRDTLVQREKQDPQYTKGVSADIRAAIGTDRPVPAEFPLGSKDPAYKVADKMWGEASLSNKAALQSAAQIARMKEMGKLRYYNVIDTETGQLTAANASELAQLTAAKPGKMILATQDGTKTMTKDASIDDIQTNINYTRDAINGLEDMDAATRTKLATVLRETDPASAVSTFLQSEAAQTLNEKEKKVVIALRSMAENVMVLRAVQGVTGASSDMVRQAMLDIIPSGKTPTKGYANEQFNILQRTLDQIKRGIPVTGGIKRVQPTTPVDQNARPIKTTTATPKPDTHIFNLTKWKKANPTGDANAARAQVQKQGFTVQE